MRSAEQLRLLRAAVDAEWRSAEEIRGRLEQLLRAGQEGNADDERIAAAALWLHHFYNAWENIFKRIADTFENRVGGDQWHAELIERMCLEVPKVRPAVIGKATRRELDAYRRFRHLVRHSYGFELEWEKMLPLLESVHGLSKRVRAELDEFLSWCDRLADGLEDAS